MKKLTKLTTLLLLTALFAACANNSGEDSGSNSVPESDKYVPEVLLSEEDIAGLKSTVKSPELKGSLSDGNWKYQTLSYTDYEGWTLSEDYKTKFFQDFTEDEIAEFESWYWRKNNGLNQYKIPLDKYISYIYIFSKENETYTVSESTQTTIYSAKGLSPLAQKVFKKRNKGEITTSKTSNLHSSECPVESDFDESNITWKTNASKTKFYAYDANKKYYLVKE